MSNSRSDDFLKQRQQPPVVSPQMAKSVSNTRRSMLEEEVESGFFRESVHSSGRMQKTADFGPSPAGFVLSSGQSKQLRKIATTSGVQDSGGFRGSGGTLRQSPDMYSPLWLNSNLNLPRDRATINAWSRAYFALNGFVQSAISLHSTYPISKLSIKCKNPEVEKFFSEMIEEIDLMNICVQIAQEFWILGEAFIYAELDEERRKWSRLIIQNPDYINVQRSVVADEPIISLRPDAGLKTICTSNKPIDVQQRQKLDPSIVEHVRRGENIPLNNFYVSHLARKINPYDVRGTGLIVSSFRALMLFDRLKECYSADTEVLTDKGFKHISDLVELSNDLGINPNYICGVQLTNNEKGVAGTIKMKEDFKVACINKETNELEYHKPIELHMSKYEGKMIHFSGKKVDTLVTPNHKMWVNKQINGKKWTGYHTEQASDVMSKKGYQKFNNTIKWVGNDVQSVNILGSDVPIELYLKFLGYLVSEGCLYAPDGKVMLSQLTSSDCYEDMLDCMTRFAALVNKSCKSYTKVVGSGYSANCPKEKWEGIICSKSLLNHFMNEIGNGISAYSIEKHLPRWVFDLSPQLLKILLRSLVFGDGTESTSKYGTGSKNYKYSTISKQLADDVYELVIKSGFVPNICVSNKNTQDNRNVTEYIVMWSDTNYGNEPLIYGGEKSQENNGGGATAKEIYYNDLVWCFEVPTGLFVTRRNNKISIQGNCKYAQASNLINPITLVKIGNQDYKAGPADLEAWRQVFEEAQNDSDFKIFTHDAVAVERVGANSAVIDINPDLQQLLKEILTGLMVPSVLMDGGADTTYANGSVALDVLKQRYMQFRSMLSVWLRKKIFAPISKINDFYEYVDKKKVLIVPDIDWNHMSLFDMSDYVNTLTTLATATEKRASYQTLYRSLGLVWEEEKIKIHEEDVFESIREKEKQAMTAMTLDQLRALGPNDPIQEPIQSPLPGEQLPGAAPPSSGGDAGGGMPPMPDLGGPPPGPDGPGGPPGAPPSP